MLKVFAAETVGADRHEVGRMLLQWKYEDLWQRSAPPIVLDANGKPRFEGDKGFFSLSYTDGWVYCALSDSEVGLDVEKVRPVNPNAIQRVLSREEWMQYSVSENPAEKFMQFWTLKEALCKFTGLGIAGTKLNETFFDLSGDLPKLTGRKDLFFWSRCVDDVVISLCSDFWHRPEFYRIEI